MTDDQTALIAEQFAHAVDLLKAEQRRQADNIETAQANLADHETRLRSLADSSTQFKFLVSMAAGGGLLSIIALIRSILP